MSPFNTIQHVNQMAEWSTTRRLRRGKGKRPHPPSNKGGGGSHEHVCVVYEGKRERYMGEEEEKRNERENRWG
jgi:hypothetical protein